jgi:hypothetical protein
MNKPCQFYFRIFKQLPILLLAFNLHLPLPAQSLQRDRTFVEKKHEHLSKPAPLLQFACLPEGFQLDDKVSASLKEKASKQPLTVKDKLLELKAHCKREKLFDGKGKEIRFFKFTCFGNPPDNYDEIVQKESRTLTDLQKHYRVLIITCDRHIN